MSLRNKLDIVFGIVIGIVIGILFGIVFGIVISARRLLDVVT